MVDLIVHVMLLDNSAVVSAHRHAYASRKRFSLANQNITKERPEILMRRCNAFHGWHLMLFYFTTSNQA